MSQVDTDVNGKAAEYAARKAVAGLNEAKIREAGGLSFEQAGAIKAALERDLLGDIDGARKVLNKVLPTAEVDEILEVFEEAKKVA
jgi:hypothetical protein